MSNSLDIGRITEYQFAADALRNHLAVFWPSALNLPFDFIVSHGAGNPLKIQVKFAGKQRGAWYKAQTCQGSAKKRRYADGSFDFFAIHCCGDWYILPPEAIKTLTWTVTPTSLEKKWSPYKNAWHLLHGASDGKTLRKAV